MSELLHQQPNDNDGVNVIDRNENSTLYERGGAGLASSQSEEYNLPHVTLEYLLQEINQLCVKKSTGSDDIPVKILKALIRATNVLESLQYISNLSLSSGTYPKAWGLAKIRPIFKTGDRLCIENYRPISLLPIILKL